MDEAFCEAVAYEGNSKEQARLGMDLIERLSLQKGSKVLDLGCGTGKLSEVLAKIVGPEGQVVAIDPDQDGLKIAKERHSTPNLSYINADADHLPGEGYDLIFSNFVLHWVKNKEPVFKQAQKILKPGGKIAFCGATNGDTYFPSGDNLVSEDFKQDMMDNWFLIDTEEMKRYVDVYGFSTEYFRSDVAHFDCENVKGLMEFYMTHSPGRLTDKSHFNVEGLETYFGSKFVVSVPQALAVYKKL